MTDTPTTTPAGNVITALAAVQLEIGGIQKMTSAQRAQALGLRPEDNGVKYAYRGIDQIAAAAQALFGKHGVVIVPKIGARETVDIEVNGRPWSDTIVMVHWSIYGPGGVQDYIEATTEGWGRDNSDKGINKAMTGAYKNLLLRLLTIGDPQDDTDGHTAERDAGRTHGAGQAPQQPAQPPLAEDDPRRLEAIEVYEAVRALPAGDKTKLGEWSKSFEHPAMTVTELALNAEWRDQLAQAVANLMVGAEPGDAGEPMDAGIDGSQDVPHAPTYGDEPADQPAAEFVGDDLGDALAEAVTDPEPGDAAAAEAAEKPKRTRGSR